MLEGQEVSWMFCGMPFNGVLHWLVSTDCAAVLIQPTVSVVRTGGRKDKSHGRLQQFEFA